MTICRKQYRLALTLAAMRRLAAKGIDPAQLPDTSFQAVNQLSETISAIAHEMEPDEDGDPVHAKLSIEKIEKGLELCDLEPLSMSIKLALEKRKPTATTPRPSAQAN